MVPAEGFEPPTYGLQNRCTTTVLSRHGKDDVDLREGKSEGRRFYSIRASWLTFHSHLVDWVTREIAPARTDRPTLHR